VSRAVGFLVRTVLLVIGLAVAAVLWIRVFGLPDRLCDEMMQWAGGAGVFALEAESIRLDRWDRLEIRGVRAYRKRVVGPACAEAESVRVDLDLGAIRRRAFCIRSVEVAGAIVRPLAFFAPASCEGGGGPPDLRFDVPVKVSGGQVQGVSVREFSCRVVGAGPDLRFENMAGTLSHGGMEGPVQADIGCSLVTGLVTGRVVTAFHPLLLEPVFLEWKLFFLPTLFRRFDFGATAPDVDAGFSVRPNVTPDLDIEAQVRLREGTYRGVPFMRADGMVHVHFSGGTNLTVGVAPLAIIRRDGVGEGQFVVDVTDETVTFDGVASMHPRAVARMVDVFTHDELKPFRFDGASRIAAKGRVDYRESQDRTAFTTTVDLKNVAFRDFLFEEMQLALDVRGRTNTITGIQGRFAEGAFAGTGEVIVPVREEDPPSYRIRVRLEDANFTRFLEERKVKVEAGIRGHLHAEADLSGLAGEGQGKTVRGRGVVRVREGRVFSLPLFGGLSTILARLIPGLDFVLRQTDATAEFVVRNGRIVCDPVSIEGDVLSIEGRGEATLDGKLDFNVRVTLMKDNTLVGKLVRSLTYPLSWLFEFRLRGTIDNPEWYPVNFSRDLLERVGLKDGVAAGKP
jgi:hypothetical protein